MDENNIQVTNNDILDALVKLNESSSATNKSVQELQAYFIAKDKKEKQEAETLKKQSEQEEKKQAELQEQEKKEIESAEAEQNAKAEEETQTYTELLTDVRDQVKLNNEIMAGQLLFFGIITGILLAKIFIDRFMKL